MKKIIPAISILLVAACLSSGAQGLHSDPNLGIIPAPANIQRQGGYFIINKTTLIEASSYDAIHCATLLNDYLQNSYGFTLLVKNAAGLSPRTHVISFDLRANTTPAEGYHLQCSHNGITIESTDGSGLFYALQSLMQMTDAAYKPPVHGAQAMVQVPCADINDYPRFPYRGMHLDCGRHFFPVSFIKVYLDLMARYKINTFHWHLTEDQGWRIEIKKYPLLTQVGSIRTQTLVGHEGSNQYDGQSYGGFYTQDEIKDVVEYARERYITVIPEIEMPGHSLAALTAYPYLGCTGGPYAVATRWGVFPDIYCAGKDSTFDFLDSVLVEVMALFPSHYIHIGGDEAPKTRWENDPRDQALMKSLGLTTADQLQSYFIQRIEKFLNSKGRDIIGWDEILEGGLAPNATVMSWRGEGGGIAAARQHHHVIMTPGDWLYFDHGQGDPAREPLNIGGYLPLSKVYSYNPVPDSLTDSEKQYILGAQANLWTEYIATPEKVEYMLMPRMLALSEIDWTPLDKKDYSNFLQRLPFQLAFLDKSHLFYRIPEPEGLVDSVTTQNKLTLKLSAYVPGVQIFYNIDSPATVLSNLYKQPIDLELPVNKPVILNVVELAPSGNTSVMYSATYIHRDFQKAQAYTAGKTGLQFSLFKSRVTRMSSLDSLKADSSGRADSFSLDPLSSEARKSVVFSGLIKVDGEGIYRFEPVTTGRVELTVDGLVILTRDRRGGSTLDSGIIPLQTGYHLISLKYLGYGNNQSLQLLYGTEGSTLQPVASSQLYH